MLVPIHPYARVYARWWACRMRRLFARARVGFLHSAAQRQYFEPLSCPLSQCRMAFSPLNPSYSVATVAVAHSAYVGAKLPF